MTAITSVGVVSPIGVGVQAFFAAIDNGTSALQPSAEHEGVSLARVGDFGARGKIAPAQLRRMPRLCQMAIVAAKEALERAKLPYPSERIGIVLGTGLGTLNETVEFMRGYVDGGPENASPLLFPSSVMNAPAGMLSLECQLRGPNSTINHKDVSALSAIGMASDLLALGRADAILVGGVEELTPPAIEAFLRLGKLTRGTMRPYDERRNGMGLGEGATMLVLEREDDARRRQADIVAVIAGRGDTSESRPRVGWGSQPFSPEAVLAVRQAMPPAGAQFCVAGGGNGTSYDERELAAISEAAGELPPTFSILAQIGESLSSSLARVACAVHVLASGRVPATVGLQTPPIRFAAKLPRTPQQLAIDSVLVPSFGQGGSNLAIRLARG